MSYTQVNAVSADIAGSAVALTAPTGPGPGVGDAVPVGSYLLVNNGGASPLTVTLKASRQYLGHTLSDTTVTVAATTQSLIGPVAADPFGITSGADVDRVYVEYSAVASVTRAVLGL
jgi:hypothetical protein